MSLRGNRNRPIALWLSIFGIGVAVPVVAFAALLFLRMAVQERTVLERQVHQETLALGAQVTGTLDGAVNTIRLIANALPGLQAGGSAGFERRTREILDPIGIRMVLADRHGKRLLDTAVPPARKLPSIEDSERLRTALNTDLPVIGRLTRDPLLGTLVVPIDLGVRTDNGQRYLLSLLLARETFQAELDRQPLPAGWASEIVDAGGVVVARTGASSGTVGHPLPRALWQHVSGAAGRFADGARGASAARASFVRLPRSHWVVFKSVPSAQFDAPFQQSVTTMLSFGVGSVMFAAFFALWCSRHIARPINELANAALTLGRGEEPVRPHFETRETRAIAEALLLAHRQLDLTEDERAMAVDRLRASEAQLREALEGAQAGIWTLDLSTGQRTWDAGTRRLLGLAADTAASIDVFREIIDPADVPEQAEAFERVASGQTSNFDCRVRWPDGSVHWIRVTGRVAADETGDGARIAKGIVVNVDELKRRERELSESGERLRELLDTLDLGTAMVRDLDGTIRFWSRGCAQLYGWTAEEAVGRSSGELLQAVYPVPLAEIEAILLMSAASAKWRRSSPRPRRWRRSGS
jgi:PAS domain S-box-containing protein